MDTAGFILRIINIILAITYLPPLIYVIKTQSKNSPQDLRFYGLFLFSVATISNSYSLLYYKLLPSTFMVTGALVLLHISAWLNYLQTKKDSVNGDK